MQVQRVQLPQQLGVGVPGRRDDCGGETVGVPEPIHPSVEFQPLDLGIVGVEQAPVDRVRGLGDQRVVVALVGVVQVRVRVIARSGSPGATAAAA